jgi:hypothetical protein
MMFCFPNTQVTTVLFHFTLPKPSTTVEPFYLHHLGAYNIQWSYPTQISLTVPSGSWTPSTNLTPSSSYSIAATTSTNVQITLSQNPTPPLVTYLQLSS